MGGRQFMAANPASMAFCKQLIDREVAWREEKLAAVPTLLKPEPHRIAVSRVE
jgi:hypothetical protein